MTQGMKMFTVRHGPPVQWAQHKTHKDEHTNSIQFIQQWYSLHYSVLKKKLPVLNVPELQLLLDPHNLRSQALMHILMFPLVLPETHLNLKRNRLHYIVVETKKQAQSSALKLSIVPQRQYCISFNSAPHEHIIWVHSILSISILLGMFLFNSKRS